MSGRFPIAILCCLGACALPAVDATELAIVRNGVVDDGSQTVDLTTDTAYVFEGSPQDASLTLVCPNGQYMPLGDWMASQSDIVRKQLESSLTSLAAVEQDARAGLATMAPVDCQCEARCEWCPDGAVICFFECADLRCAH